MSPPVDVLSAVSYGIGLAAFVGFSVQLAFRFRASRRASYLLVAVVLSSIWELSGLAFALWPSDALWILYQVSDSGRFGAWIWFVASLLPNLEAQSNRAAWSGRVRLTLALGPACLLALASLSRALPDRMSMFSSAAWIFGLWVSASILGLVVCEQLFRNTPEARRWGIKPLCLALGALYGFDLFMFSDGMLLREIDRDLWSVRGLAHALAIPLVMLATVRNRSWRIDVAVSRTVVFRSTALLLSGLYLLAVAGAGYFVRSFGGDWGKAIQTTFLFAALLLLALLFSSGTIRSRLRVLVSKHFFSYRYDYREEWLRFTNLLATASGELSIPERSIKALADLVESPGGALWLASEDGIYRPAGRWNLPEIVGEEQPSGSLAAFLARTGWVIDLGQNESDRQSDVNLELPDWLTAVPDGWLLLPLSTAGNLIGFVVLVRPRTSVEMNWEVRDLLKTAARQAASFLGHVRATEALIEAKQFDAFNRMSAFVVHDLKNLVAQLSLMLKNAEKHASNPEFQKDMVSTIQHVVDRMTRLLLQLRSGATPIENPRSLDMVSIIKRVEKTHTTGDRNVAVEIQPALRALGHEERLERVIGHLVQNALDATPAGGAVRLRAWSEIGETIVEVTDTGQGMSAEFMRDHLFKPFHSTKTAGMGIGAYESHQYVTELGGRISVESTPGVGTSIRVFLKNPEGIRSQPHQEAA